MSEFGPTIASIADMRKRAKARLPRMVFDYIDGGAADELTMRDNERVYSEIKLKPRSAVSVPTVDLRTTVLGAEWSLPFGLAPVGSSRMFWPRGEALAAAAAGEAGTSYTLSTLSGTRLEEVKAATTGPAWYQLYLAGGRDVARGAIARAAAAGFSAIVVTIDTNVAGNRERDVRNGTKQLLSRDPLTMLPHVGQIITRPFWLLDFMRDGGLMSFPNVVLPSGPMGYGDIGQQLGESAVSWDDFGWISEAWGGPIVVKGVHTAEEARKAADLGASVVVVSNHGGRQLDGVPGTLRVLPEVLDAVGDRLEVLLDGGIRRGSDIVKALALGARAVLVGRAYTYGLAAGGQAGVARSISILREEIILTMKLLGCGSLGELGPDYLRLPAGWPGI